MSKIFKLIIFFYKKLIPIFLRNKLRGLEFKFKQWHNPLTKTIISDLAIDDLFEACKKETYNKENNIYKNHYLHKTFKKYLIRSHLIEDEWWSDLIYLTTLPFGTKFDKINKLLINKIHHGSFNSLDYFEVLHIYSLSIRLGLFELGYHLRNKSLEITLSHSNFEKKSQIWKLKAKLSALLEIEDFLEFDRLYLTFDDQWEQEKKLLNFLRNIIEHPSKASSQNLFSKLDTKNYNFRKFVENKKIVIVGPSPTDKNDGFLIDNADLVVRNNYINSETIGNNATKGSRCEISYINTEITNFIAEGGYSKWSPQIIWIIAKSLNDKKTILNKLSLDKVKTEKLNVRNLVQINQALFNGSLHALPNIVIDLLKFNPKEIFLYHFDLMLTKERMKEYYPDYWRKKIKKKGYLIDVRLNGLAKHDPVTQFVLLKKFWSRGIIKGDSRFEEIIKMNVEEYMINLQKYYRDTNDTNISMD